MNTKSKWSPPKRYRTNLKVTNKAASYLAERAARAALAQRFPNLHECLNAQHLMMAEMKALQLLTGGY